MKISKLRSILLQIKKEQGDLEIYMSSDSEGNSYGTLGKEARDSIHWDEKRVILYPFQECIELDFDPEPEDNV